MILRHPKFGNTYTTDPNVIVRNSLDGTPIIFKRPGTNYIETRKISFEALTVDQKNQLRDFLYANAASEFNIADHEGNTIKCLCTNDEITFQQTGDGCQYAATIDIEILEYL